MNFQTRRFWVIKYLPILLFIGVCLGEFQIGFAQSTGEDYDVLVIPVGPSSAAPGRDLTSSESLEARGLQLVTVPGYPLGQASVSEDRLTLHLKAGEAIQVLSQWTEGIPVSATSVYFSATVSTQGEPMTQAALALLDANDPNQQDVSISFAADIPNTTREFSLEYRRAPGKVLVLIQAVGPEQGESTLILDRMRLLDGYRELDFSLGATAVTAIENFGEGIDSVIINPIANTNPGYMAISNLNHRQYPATVSQSLLLGTRNVDEVIQVVIPLQIVEGAMEAGTYPRRFYGLASVRRLSGESGTFTAALASGITASVGYENHPLTTLPTDRWEDVQCPLQLTEAGATQLFLIVQLQGGPAEVVVDDVSIHARRDSMYLWDSRVVPGN